MPWINRYNKYGMVLKIVSRNLFILAISMLICVGIGILLSEKATPFLFSFLFTLITGLALAYLSRHHHEETLQQKEAYLAVALSWILISIFGSLPYLFSNAIPGFIDAFFESVSGFTTTGSSILTDIESLPKSILFWRSLTHWIGGIGIIVLFIVIMPRINFGGYRLFTLESSLHEKILPQVKSVGYRLLLIYLFLTITETILLLLGGMNLFESICHTFGTVATGGFSPKNTSISGYSPYIQYVVMIFMLLSGMNYIIHYYLIHKQWGKIRKNEELRFYLLVVILVGSFVSLALIFFMRKPFEHAVRDAFFQVISIVTCTGYATADYMLWPQYLWITIFFIMFLGGSTGSTAGGIKMARHLTVFKNISRMFRQLSSPNAIIPVYLNGNAIDEESNRSILSFVSIYFLIFIIGSILLLILGIEGKTAFSSVATSMAGIGPGLAKVGPAGNFSHLPDLAKIILSLLMLIGRLEIYTILLLFTKSYWRE